MDWPPTKTSLIVQLRTALWASGASGAAALNPADHRCGCVSGRLSGRPVTAANAAPA